MAKTVAIGIQSFDKMIEGNYFYIDKTDFIKEGEEESLVLKYKKQLELNKVNAQNDIAKANRVAQQYLNNYLRQQGVQGSGMGASAVAGLGANYASEIANSNANYDNKLTDYRNTYNENLLSQENLALLQGMDNESAREYINSVSQDSGVNADTINKLNAYNAQFSKERNQPVYIRVCDKLDNCSKSLSTYIRIDKILIYEVLLNEKNSDLRRKKPFRTGADTRCKKLIITNIGGSNIM